MAGVEFSLYQCTQADVAGHTHDWLVTTDSGNCWGDPISATSAPDGLVEFSGLAPGDYMLVETQTLPGYQLPYGQWLVVIGSDGTPTITAHGPGGADSTTLPPAFKTGDNGLMLPNYLTMTMPFAGGMGVIFFTVFGIAILGAAVIFAFFSRRRRES